MSDTAMEGWAVLACTTADQVVEVTKYLRDSRGYDFIGWQKDSLDYLRTVIDGYLVCNRNRAIYIRYHRGGPGYGSMCFELTDNHEPPYPVELFLRDWRYNDD